jgi:type II restriction/modification system DNA methylase subunit YeeA
LTDGHRAKVEEKPEVRKAGGVYYTPTYIVDYIVKQTVGPLVDGKTPKQVEKLTVLDPACGSGSFLLGAFEFLLAWHLEYYTKNDPEKWAKQKPARIYETNPNAQFVVERAVPSAFSDAHQASAQGTARSTPIRNWQLTTAERKRILTANLYGVDIDTQAVEVTKLSLLLKVLDRPKHRPADLPTLRPHARRNRPRRNRHHNDCQAHRRHRRAFPYT